MALLLLVVVAGIAWMFVAPGRRFLPKFAELLTDPTVHRSPFSFFSGRSYATGTFKARPAVVRLQLKRTKYGQGYLVLALRTAGAQSFDNDGIERRTPDGPGRRALVSIARQDLLLTVEDGWLKALWRPQGFTIFPGQFSEDQWRDVLDALHTIASSLDAAGTVSPETDRDS